MYRARGNFIDVDVSMSMHPIDLRACARVCDATFARSNIA
ncbi:hypothetical protein TMO_0952 [Tistrella mobilis KA081020-065]|uniref:Uncharacterized protein n=1 Tax=Tistrella mobilis (strain KA081020-065) TaxID=1110502 RepID=I3TJ53_TISMK|nr:hypothetical protein TMO_0952 [Tistrella mobilis KA081020-065]